jgi:hypothetical protein
VFSDAEGDGQNGKDEAGGGEDSFYEFDGKFTPIVVLQPAFCHPFRDLAAVISVLTFSSCRRPGSAEFQFDVIEGKSSCGTFPGVFYHWMLPFSIVV